MRGDSREWRTGGDRAHAGGSVAYSADGHGGWEMGGEVESVEEGDGGA